MRILRLFVAGGSCFGRRGRLEFRVGVECFLPVGEQGLCLLDAAVEDVVEDVCGDCVFGAADVFYIDRVRISESGCSLRLSEFDPWGGSGGGGDVVAVRGGDFFVEGACGRGGVGGLGRMASDGGAALFVVSAFLRD